jgi:serine/threonine-protein kinase
MVRRSVSASNAERPAPPVQRGDIIDGKYLVGECIAWGGMGIVSAATHIHLRKEVALKCIRPEFMKNREVVSRFLNEARAAASLRSEHVARVFDFGMTKRGVPYLVMERLKGSSLSAVLRQWGPLPVCEVVDYVLQACESLAEAHALGIVHRDIKPENLFLVQGMGNQPILKVLDFGISKQVAADVDRTLTNPSSSMGSPWYMSPEQMRNARDVDVRTDIWSIGVVLYELLTDTTPFCGRNLTEVCASVMCDAPPSTCALRTGIPFELDAIVRRCLAKDRNERFADVTEVARALTRFASPAGRALVPRVEGAAIGSARSERSSTDSSAPCVRPPKRAIMDSRLTRIPGEHYALTPMIAAIALVATAILGAASSLGYDIARPVEALLGRNIALQKDATGPPAVAHDIEPRFVAKLGPAMASAEHEAPYTARPAPYSGRTRVNPWLPTEPSNDAPVLPASGETSPGSVEP